MKKRINKSPNVASTEIWTNTIFEKLNAKVAKTAIEDFYSKDYAENLRKYIIYKNCSEINDSDLRRWKHQLVACICHVSRMVTKPFCRKFPEAYYVENFFFGWGGDAVDDYMLDLNMWLNDDGKFYPDFVPARSTAEKIFEINKQISQCFSPRLAQRKVLKIRFVDIRLSEILDNIAWRNFKE